MDELLVIDSRMAWHFTEGTFKIYLSADAETSALRIMNANRVGEHAATLEETVRETKARRESEKKRYMEQYGVDIKNMNNYSLIVDTSHATPDEVAERIISSFAEWQSNREMKAVYITPERLNFPVTPPNEEKVSTLAARLECREEIPEVTVIEEDGEFYLAGGVESALAHSFNFSTFIPARLVDGKPSGEYTKMKNSL